MRLNGLHLGVMTLALLVALQVAGCGKKRPELPPIDKAAAVGEWLEIDRNEIRNARIQGGKPLEFYRYLTLNEDGTFEFSLQKKSGKPHAKQKITGTWDVDAEKNQIVFTVVENQFPSDSERHGWAPAYSRRGVARHTLKKEGQTDTLAVADTAGRPTSYKRVK